MIRFLFKGLMRDRSRSLFPILTVVIGVMLTVFLYNWINGAEFNFIDSSARFNTGHVKVMSRAYAREADQVPNDLALVGVRTLLDQLRQQYPDMIWTPRIRFGGLLDIPDAQGETRDQGPVMGLAVDLLSAGSPEPGIFKLEEALVRGRVPQQASDILISEDFARRLNVQPGDTATLISVTMQGSMAVANFTVAGTIRFGVEAMDRGAMIADIAAVRAALDMEDAAGEVLGFFADFLYRDEKAKEIVARFNSAYSADPDEFAPVMDTLSNQAGMADLLAMMEMFSSLVLVVFIAVMSIVLWNAGLMGSLRRYGEIGVRLAMGETKTHIYGSLIMEALIIGALGTLIGTAVGLAESYYLQAHGLDIGFMMKNASLFVSNVMRAKVSPVSYGIGFIPGLAATFLGASISGLGIYRRQTSQLMKELET
jgi:putative ABC transport system permease protein